MNKLLIRLGLQIIFAVILGEALFEHKVKFSRALLIAVGGNFFFSFFVAYVLFKLGVEK